MGRLCAVAGSGIRASCVEPPILVDRKKMQKETGLRNAAWSKATLLISRAVS